MNAKEHLRHFLWTVNFFQLKEDQMERLFPFTIGPLMGCHWWEKEKEKILNKDIFMSS